MPAKPKGIDQWAKAGQPAGAAANEKTAASPPPKAAGVGVAPASADGPPAKKAKGAGAAAKPKPKVAPHAADAEAPAPAVAPASEGAASASSGASSGAGAAASAAAGATDNTHAPAGSPAKTEAGDGAAAGAKKIKFDFDQPPAPLSLQKILAARVGSDPMQEYIKELVPSVQYRLKKYLTSPPAGSVLAATRRELREHQPLAINNMQKGDALTTFREAFSFTNVQTALGNVGLYEAAGNLFWLDPLLHHWDGVDLQGNDLVWTQLVAARTLWDRQALIGSCPENESLRRLAFPSFLPSAVGDLSDIHGVDGAFWFHDTPLFSGQAIVIAWYEAMDRALRLENEDCHSMIKHLWQAAMSVPIRYRLSPSTTQVQLDGLNYSEVLRQAGTACIDSFWDFGNKVISLQPLAHCIGNPKNPATELVNKCCQLALRYKGKDVSRHTALALDALSPFIRSPACHSKYKRLESVTTCLNDCTKLYKIAQATSKYYCSAGPEAATGAFGTLLDVLRLMLQTNSLQADQLSLAFLTAERQAKGTAGFVHLVFKKMELTDYLEAAINNQPLAVPHVSEIKNSVFPVLLTMEAATLQWVPDASMLTEEAVADAENNWLSATSAGWEDFKKSLTPIAASFAELLYNMWGGEYDEELTVLAGQALSGPTKPWHKYLDPEKPEGEPSALQEQWNAYVSAVMAKPKAIGEHRVAADAIDTASAAKDGMDESTKDNLQKTICELRKRKVTFAAAAGAMAALGAYVKALNAFFEQSRVGKKWKRGKDEVRAFLLCADLFHKHAERSTRETCRGVIASVADDFSEVIKSLLQKRRRRTS